MSKPLPSSTSFGANITPTYWSASQILGHSEGRAGYSDNQVDYHEHHHHDQHYAYPNHNHFVDDDYGSDLVDEVLEVSTSESKCDLNISDETSSTLPMLAGGHKDKDYVPQEKKRQGEETVRGNISQV